MFIKSLRWKLVLWLALMLGCILLGFGVTAYELHRTNQLNQIDQELRRRVAALNTTLHGAPGSEGHSGRDRFGGGPEGPFLGAPPDRSPAAVERDQARHHPPRRSPSGLRSIHLGANVLSLFDQTDTNGFYFVIWSSEGSELTRSLNAPAQVPLPEKTDSAAAAAARTRGDFREVYHFTAPGERLLAGRSIKFDLESMSRFGAWLAAAGAGVLALGMAGVWQLASRTIKPVEAMAATARRIAVGNLSERMEVANPDDELGKLGVVLNATFTRLEAAFAQQKQFAADASHELRTPLTVLITEAQTALARERGAAEYRETVQICLEAGQQMRRLTELLLQLARFDSGQETIQGRRVDLATVAEAWVERIKPLARGPAIRIDVDLQPVPIVGDPDRLGQLITNLLANAINYNRESGQIRIETHQEETSAVLVVTDTGQGIAPEDLPLIFDRFYRADAARSGGLGRTGLGLAISKSIVLAHGGTIDVSSVLGQGSTFVVRLPALKASGVADC